MTGLGGLLAWAAWAACATSAAPLARIALHCNDSTAELRVDGAPAGTAGDYEKRKLSLPPGHHRLELRAASGQVEVREATLGPGDEVALQVNLGSTAKGVAQ